MKATTINRITDLIVSSIMESAGDELLSMSYDSLDSAVQNSVDRIETEVYEKLFSKINLLLEARNLTLIDKWWE